MKWQVLRLIQTSLPASTHALKTVLMYLKEPSGANTYSFTDLLKLLLYYRMELSESNK